MGYHLLIGTLCTILALMGLGAAPAAGRDPDQPVARGLCALAVVCVALVFCVARYL